MKIPGTQACYGLSTLQGYSAAVRIRYFGKVKIHPVSRDYNAEANREKTGFRI
jgi:hypothetical protein